MKKLLLLGFGLIISNASQAGDLIGTLEAEWAVTRAWQAASPRVAWIDATPWQTDISTQLAVEKDGFNVATTVSPSSIELSHLYLDVSASTIDWSVGIKPQEWGYAHSAETLNWITDQPVLMGEAYTSLGSVQAYCADPEQNYDLNCGVRLSGWQPIEWQWLMRWQESLSLAVAAQTTLGQASLIYLEALWQQDATQPNLSSVFGEVAELQWRKAPAWQSTLGLQYTSTVQTTLHYEWHVNSSRLTHSEWDRIFIQLTTDYAGLVAGAFDTPQGQQQHLFRISQPWHSFTGEYAAVYWPGNDSVMQQLNLQYELSGKLEAYGEWHWANDNSALSQIGYGQVVRMGLRLTDGF